MSSIQHHYSTPSKIFSSFNEHRWVAQIRKTLEEELEDDDNDAPVSIFNVPKILMAVAPDSYTPQQVAIGPYHYWRPELYEMERYKLAAAKRAQRNYFLNNHKFQDIVHHLIIYEPRIRACYHKYLDLSGEGLAWMMAIDASFLLEFLHLYAIKLGGNTSISALRSRVVSSRMSHLLDHTRQKSAHNTILRDIVMLENQIPLFVLRKMLGFQFSTLEEADDILNSMLLGFCRELSPLKPTEGAPTTLVKDCPHLLDFFYKMVTTPIELAQSEENIEIVEESQSEDQGFDKDNLSFGNSYKKLLCVILSTFCAIWKILKKINQNNGPIKSFFKRVFLARPVNYLFLKLPLRILSFFPGFRILLNLVVMLLAREKEETKLMDGQEANKPPLIEEIAVPSVTDLSKSNVHFCPTNGGLSTLSFDAKTVTFYLPTISLDVNTEAILRNLVAYEASVASGPLVFTRYTEIMNGIIDTEEDVKLLREKGIILNHLKSDEEAANLWNGMSKSIRLTRVPFLDKVIEDVNKYHDGKWKAKFGKFMKRHVFGSWQFLTLLAAIWMLLLIGLRAFCTFSTCRRFVLPPSGQ